MLSQTTVNLIKNLRIVFIVSLTVYQLATILAFKEINYYQLLLSTTKIHFAREKEKILLMKLWFFDYFLLVPVQILQLLRDSV